MRVLAMDTSTNRLSVALMNDGTTLCEINLEVKAGHAGILLAVIDEVLGKASVPRSGIDLIAVGTGPGSFTGIRIGIATAKGLAAALDIPLAGIPTLDAVARGAAPCPMGMAAVLDAKKGEVFFALYDPEANLLGGPVNIPPEGAADFVRSETVFAGNACAVYRDAFRDALGGNYREAPEHLWYPRASVIGSMALDRATWRRSGEVLPLYVRESDAVISLKKKGLDTAGDPGA